MVNKQNKKPAVRRPYFYIIKDKNTGIKYAGAKWAQDANPDTFLQAGGYTTSSTKINEILNSTNEVQFSIEEIIEEHELNIPVEWNSVEHYESWFLDVNECRGHPDWYNKRKTYPYHSPEYKAGLLSKYGVTDPNKIPGMLERKRLNSLEKYGVEHHTQRPEFQEAMKKYNLETYGVTSALNTTEAIEDRKLKNLKLYGVEHHMQRPEIREKAVKTNLEKYGFENPMKNSDIKNKAEETNLEKYGFKHALQRPEIQAAIRQKCLEKYGVEHFTKTEEYKNLRKTQNLERFGFEYSSSSPIVKEQVRKTNLLNNGVEYPMQSKEIRKKSINSCLGMYGVDNVAKVPYFCGECNSSGLGMSAFSKHKTHDGAYHQRGEYYDLAKTDRKMFTKLMNSLLEGSNGIC